jgi:hypothetical protein
MSDADKDAILQAAAKTLALELFAAAEYCRTRSRISVEKFDCELRSALRKWKATRRNLNQRKEQ